MPDDHTRGPSSPSEEERLFAQFLAAASDPNTPAAGLRAAGDELCAPHQPEEAADPTRSEQMKELLRRTESEHFESEPSGTPEAWISLDRPADDTIQTRRAQDKAEAKPRGFSRFFPKRRRLFVLVLLAGAAVIIAKSKGCAVP